MIYSIMHTTVYQFWQSVIDHYARSSFYTAIKLYVGHFLWPHLSCSPFYVLVDPGTGKTNFPMLSYSSSSFSSSSSSSFSKLSLKASLFLHHLHLFLYVQCQFSQLSYNWRKFWSTFFLFRILRQLLNPFLLLTCYRLCFVVAIY